MLKNVSIDRARRRHSCQRDEGHVIQADETRMTIVVGRDERRYCMACATAALDAAEAKLARLRLEMSR